ncbi:MAG: hypothetical protein H0Z18_10945 [Thermococcus sp.]|uniref:DUF7344 domain-containing protein n=1 Tax=Thermococcus sp. TaxID=35749 RepID=UPI001DCE1CB8|nr:hypothetical protein [Thermococcus sp.]MBO8175762.1 hypothetical protein [Thermococcus sp.]
MTTSAMILGNDRRMFIIEYLQKCNGKAELRDLVQYIAEKEGNTDRKHRKSVYVSLIQTHIPKMEREGIIEFQHGTIELIQIPENVDVYMEIVNKNDIRWASVYSMLALGSAGMSYYVKSWEGFVISTVFLALSLIQRFKEKRIVKRKK